VLTLGALLKVLLIVLELPWTPGVAAMGGMHRKVHKTLRKAKKAMAIL
jgi:hypothetical protein